MSKHVEAMKLLIVENSSDDAEHLTSMLRNAGIAVRTTQADDLDDLQAQLQKQTPDLILAGSAIPLADIVQATAHGDEDLVIISVLRQWTMEDILAAFRLNVTAVASIENAELFVSVVQREFDRLVMRRSLRRLKATLAESERRCDTLLESARDPIAYVHEGAHVRANHAWLNLFGYANFDDLQGASILDLVAPEATASIKSLLKDIARGEKPPESLPVKMRRADGGTFDTVMEFAPASMAGEPCQQIILRQPRVDPDLEHQIDTLRTKDLVTDLYNRQHGLAELDRMVAAAATGTTNQIFFLIEADNFRAHLDNIGIGNTDLLLGDMANLLRRQLGESSEHIAFRFGDQSLAVLSPALPLAAASDLAHRICAAFAEHEFIIGKQTLTLTLSISGVLISERNANSQAVLNQADSGLREVQQRGGNDAVIHDPGVRAAAELAETQKLHDRLKAAVETRRFSLYSQPLINLHGVDGEFFEISVRLDDDEGSMMPGDFSPIAEETGLTSAIDRIVIANTIATLAEREKAGRSTTFFVKLAVESLADETLVPWIAQLIKATHVRGNALVFGMPESKVVTRLKAARSFVRELKKLHCAFALEQFGGNASSFQLLKQIDASYLKLAPSYIHNLSKNKENQGFVHQFCQQAHQAGKIVIAEFVEDAASMSVLFTCGVNFVQGNYLNEPEKISSAA